MMGGTSPPHRRGASILGRNKLRLALQAGEAQDLTVR